MLGSHLATVEALKACVLRYGRRMQLWSAWLAISMGGTRARIRCGARTGGVWEIFLPAVEAGTPYKYAVQSRFRGYSQQKADPFGFWMETPPKSATRVADLSTYEWQDQAWMEKRAQTGLLDSPMSVYEVHLGSWMRDYSNQPLSYRELAERLVPYVKEMGYTHIELMPIAEHPYSAVVGLSGDWVLRPDLALSGRRKTSCTSSTPAIKQASACLWIGCRRNFPKDAHGLGYFDGTALYEHQDPRLGEHSRLGNTDFQLWAERSASVSDFERDVLAEEVPYRWPACRCGSVHAVSRLLA